MTNAAHNPGETIRAERNLRFRSAAEIAQAVPAEVTWYLEGYIPESSLVDLVSPPKVGKTTFALALCTAILDGKPFMGLPTHKTPIVYLTEQSESTFRRALAKAGLLGRTDLSVLFWRETHGFAWQVIVASAQAECKRIGAKLLVVDTFHQFAGLEGDEENSAGETLKALRPLQKVRDSGISVLTMRHERKAGGKVAEAGRGSSAFAGAADILIALGLPVGRQLGPMTLRVLKSASRFDETPDALTIELTEGGFVIRDESEIGLQATAVAILRALTEKAGEGLTLPGLLDALETPRTSIQRALTQLEKDRLVTQVGRGVKGDPKKYRMTPEIHSAQIQSAVGQEQIQANLVDG